MTRETAEAFYFLIGFLIGGVSVLFFAVVAWKTKTECGPTIHTCSKHNYTGTKECPDCKKEE